MISTMMEAPLPLTEVPVGTKVRIRHFTSQPELCTRLRELGFCENAIVRCINRVSGSVLCEVCNTRIGLNQLVASSIYVSSFAE